MLLILSISKNYYSYLFYLCLVSSFSNIKKAPKRDALGGYKFDLKI